MSAEPVAAGPAWLVIGVGNRDRGDDGVGPYVCDRLRRRVGEGARVVVCEGSTLDLPLRWGPGDRVIVVDAVAPGARPGRVVTLDVTDDPLPHRGSVSTHDVDVSAAIELARALGRMPSRLLVVGVEAEHTDVGASMSAPVVAAADAVVDQLAELCRAITPGV